MILQKVVVLLMFNNLLWMVSRAIAETAPAADDVAQQTEQMVDPMLSLLTTALPLILMVVVFYFLMIRPQRKKDKKVKDMLAQLKVGDRVTTIGGIHGTIMGIKDDTVTLGVGAEKTKLVFARWAIRNVDEVSISNDSETLV